MSKNVERRGLQYGFGREFGENPQIDDFCRKVLGLLPRLERYEPLAIVTSLEVGGSKNILLGLKVRASGGEREAVVLSGLGSFQDYCQDNKVRGMVVIVPSLGLDGISFLAQRALGDFFVGIGKVKNPDNYRIWFVDKSAADLPTEPKDEVSKKRLDEKKGIVGEMGLCGVEYRHPRGQGIGFFMARPEKKRVVKEKDVSGDERIRFLKEWMGYVIEYRGGKVISSAELDERLKHSKSFLTAMQAVSDARGVFSQEACGCLVHTSLNGDSEDILKCDGEKCFRKRKPRDSKPSFELGKEYSWTKCGDCGVSQTRKAYGADMKRFDLQKGIRVFYEVACPGFDSHPPHSHKGTVWVDPARILNPIYIYYVGRKNRAYKEG